MPRMLEVLPVPPASPAPPLFLATAAPASCADGFYELEEDSGGPFRWMQASGTLAFEPRPVPRYLELWAYSEFQDLSQRLHLAFDEGTLLEEPLVGGWAPLSMPVPAGARALRLSLNKIFPPAYYPSDRRRLGIRIRPARLHEDPERHGHVARQHANGVANLHEMLAGRTELTSTPPSLGIDLYGVCNVKPPCVYCEWDFSKELEGDNVDRPFDRETLREWGPFFDNAVSLVNCSIGEPFMMRNFDDLLDIFGNSGKVLEMTTNGQILTDRNIQKLLGRQIDLYISLDAATPGTYARLRNDTFDKILRNLRRLIEAKGGPGGLPRVHLVFMPMRVNVHELDAFVDLCADLRVDRLVLRPLNYSDTVDLKWEREGYRFEYQRELLPFDELVRASGRAAARCRQRGVVLADQMDFGGSFGALFDEAFKAGGDASPALLECDTPGRAPDVAPPAPPPAPPRAHEPPPEPVRASGGAEPLPSLGTEKRPACLEPWKSLYILRRGVLPCCYGSRPIAGVDEYKDAWNSPLMQAIRGDLLAGRFHDYCLQSAACPIVRKSEEAALLPRGQAFQMWARRQWLRFDRRTGGRTRRVLWVFRFLGARLLRALTEPRYVVRQVTRVVRLVIPGRRSA